MRKALLPEHRNTTLARERHAAIAKGKVRLAAFDKAFAELCAKHGVEIHAGEEAWLRDGDLCVVRDEYGHYTAYRVSDA